MFDIKSKQEEIDFYRKGRNKKPMVSVLIKKITGKGNKLQTTYMALHNDPLEKTMYLTAGKELGPFKNLKVPVRRNISDRYKTRGLITEIDSFHYMNEGVKTNGLIFINKYQTLFLTDILPLSSLSMFKDHWRMKCFIEKGFKCANPACTAEGTHIAISREMFSLACVHVDIITASRKLMTVDHILPVSKGGTDDVSNLRPMCESCNQKLGNSQKY